MAPVVLMKDDLMEIMVCSKTLTSRHLPTASTTALVPTNGHPSPAASGGETSFKRDREESDLLVLSTCHKTPAKQSDAD